MMIPQRGEGDRYINNNHWIKSGVPARVLTTSHFRVARQPPGGLRKGIARVCERGGGGAARLSSFLQVPPSVPERASAEILATCGSQSLVSRSM